MINMKGLVQLVDKVGGITVNNPFDFDISIEENEPEYTAKIPPGRQEIDGEQALVYSRMRYQDQKETMAVKNANGKSSKRSSRKY